MDSCWRALANRSRCSASAAPRETRPKTTIALRPANGARAYGYEALISPPYGLWRYALFPCRSRHWFLCQGVSALAKISPAPPSEGCEKSIFRLLVRRQRKAFVLAGPIDMAQFCWWEHGLDWGVSRGCMTTQGPKTTAQATRRKMAFYVGAPGSAELTFFVKEMP